jgi:hypothetical protein
MPKEETKLHIQAFEYYYSLGLIRSMVRVAKKFGVAQHTVASWSSDFEWQKRVKERDAEISGLLTADNLMNAGEEKPLDGLGIDESMVKDIANLSEADKIEIRTKYREVVLLAIQCFKQRLLSNRVKVNIGDIQKLIQLDLSLLGENLNQLDINIKGHENQIKDFEDLEEKMSEEEKVKFYQIISSYKQEAETSD